MKRFAKFQAIFLTITVLLSIILLCTPGVSAIENEVTVVLDGEALTFDVPGRLIGDCTMVPLRGIFEALGAQVEWDGATRTAILTSTDGDMTLADANGAYYNRGLRGST